MARRFVKAPAARLDYGFDWSAWLDDGETIVSKAVTATGVVVESSSIIDGTQVVAWISGGAAVTEAEVTFSMTTSQARTDVRTLEILVMDR